MLYYLGNIKDGEKAYIEFYLISKTNTLMIRWLEVEYLQDDQVSKAHLEAGSNYVKSLKTDNILEDTRLMNKDFAGVMDYLRCVIHEDYLKDYIKNIYVVTSTYSNTNDAIKKAQEAYKDLGIPYKVFDTLQDAAKQMLEDKGMPSDLANANDLVYAKPGDSIEQIAVNTAKMQLVDKEKTITQLRNEITTLELKLEHKQLSKKLRWGGILVINLIYLVFKEDIHSVVESIIGLLFK